MERMVSDLLDSTRLHAGRPLALDRRPTALVMLARRAVANAQQATDRHTIRLEAGSRGLVGSWDASRLERVLENLLSNAVRYSPGGGEIVVRVRREGRGATAVAPVEVQDQGVGIPAKDLAHIFERYRRGSNVQDRIAGSGIGLAGVYDIVRQHGGEITVESEEGVGSTFSLRLPIQARPDASAAGASETTG
jgi:signal transduction histidine kinase